MGGQHHAGHRGRNLLIAAAALLWFCSCVSAAELYEITVRRVKDGDTIVADIHLPFDITLRKQDIRCNDYDAWESSRARRSVEVTDAEIERGKAAAADLRRLLASADTVWISPDEDDARDVYGRILGGIAVEKGGKRFSLAAWMKERGHLRTE